MSDTKTPARKTGASTGSTQTQADLSLAELPVGQSAVIVSMKPGLRGKKKFADVGLVPGTILQMEAHAPFGGLMRVRVMESSMALHSDDAENIVMERSAEA